MIKKVPIKEKGLVRSLPGRLRTRQILSGNAQRFSQVVGMELLGFELP